MKNITSLYQKYLDSLKNEISLYQNESDLWKLAGDIKNSPGNLALHLCGNLQHNFGAVLGNTGYIRNRDLEFSRKDAGKQDILNEISITSEIVLTVLENLTDERLAQEFPDKSHGEGQTVSDMLVRLAFHLAYHVGQINYHRRILTF